LRQQSSRSLFGCSPLLGLCGLHQRCQPGPDSGTALRTQPSGVVAQQQGSGGVNQQRSASRKLCCWLQHQPWQPWGCELPAAP
jgi:hypothetical protein